MKKVILLVLLMPLPAFGQIVENFESGSLTNWLQSIQGRWKADTISSISGKYSLHHIFDNPEAGTDRIGIPVKNMHPSEGICKWSFLIRHGYDPSSSNNWSVFLMSDVGPDAMSADGTAKGFAIGVNLTGYDDTLRLWKVKGKELTTVVTSGINWQSAIGISKAVKIVVERSQTGNWTVSILSQDGKLIDSSSGTDNELFIQGWFGIYYRYSSTRDRLLWIDDLLIEGKFYEDNEAPSVISCETSGRDEVRIVFSEEPSTETLVASNFALNEGNNRSVSVIRKNELTYVVKFGNCFINKILNNLIINNICDKSGNCKQEIRIQFTPVWAERSDVIISEVMADPFPEVSLPGKEYIEITNRTNFSFNLENWKLSSGDQDVLFPGSIIKSGEIMIITLSQDTSLFTKYGRVTGLKQFPALTDGGKIVCISDSSGNLIHGIEYSSDWYGDELKSGGGWSLEMIDTDFPFSYEGNWSASSSRKGGTPGSANSVSRRNPDNSFYGIENVYPVDNTSIKVRFSEPLFDLPDMIRSISAGGKEIIDINPADPLSRMFSVNLLNPLQQSEVYHFKVSGDIKDFAGNEIQKGMFAFGLPEPAERSDILFNELLFNPLPGNPDYIEFYNCSEKIIDLYRLQLVTVNDDNGDTSQVSLITDEKRCIMPDSYYAITTDREKIIERYFSADPSSVFETGYLPAMSDDKGHLVLFNRELDKIDEVTYNDKMHYSLLSDHEGIALEKTGKRNKSDETGNWHSASESAGWGTPGAPNSVFAELPATSDKVVLSSSRISPDNDGNEDLLAISLNLTGNGNVVSITVFDETGNYVKKVASNMLVGQGENIIWDGTADDGTPVNTGIYIVYITLYDDTGKTNHWKKVCTVIRN
jgi:hypothetical protein